MTRLRRTIAQKGMTLVELLVALAIISVVIVLGLGLTQAAKRLYVGAERRQFILDAAAAQQFLKAQIESAAPVVVGIESGRPVLDFRGGADSLEFVSAAPVQAEAPVMQRTRLYVVGENLVLERAAMAGGERVERRILASGIAQLRLAYLESTDEAAAAPAFQWSGRSQFPALVLVTVITVPQAPAWPQLAAQPRLAASW